MIVTVTRWAKFTAGLSLCVLAACNSDNNGPSVQTGQFVDAAVANIGYRTATQSGVTDADGNYNYFPGEQVTFFIGDLEFPPVTAKGVVTPLDIALEGDSSATINSDVAVNVARLLQSLDSDGDPSNGIDIPAAASPSASIDLRAPAATFETAFTAEFPTVTLVTASAAVTHLQSELDALDGGSGDGGGGSGSGSSAQVCPNGGSPTSVSTLPAALASQSIDVTATTSNAGSPIALNQAVNFVFSSSGKLFVDDVDISDAPYQCPASTAEYLWYDEGNKIIYAVAVINDAFHEVSVSSDTGTFLASLEAASSGDGGAAVAEAELKLMSSYAGSYTVTASAGTHQSGSVVISADGKTIEFDTGVSFDVSSADVVILDQITANPDKPQIFVSVQENGEVKHRLTIFLDASDTTQVIGFDYVTDLSQSNEQTVSLTLASTASSGPNGTTSAATINAGFVGDYTLVYSQSSAGGPFTDKQEVSVTIAANGNLTIGASTYSSPFNRDIGSGPHLPEIIWLDSTINIEFALSDNQSGNFNEINVGDTSKPTSSVGLPAFLGQLREKEKEVTAADVVGKYAGSYNFTITEGSNAGDAFAFTVGADGSISYVLDGSDVTIAATETTYLFNDTRERSTIEPGVEVSHRVPDEADGTFSRVKLFLEGEDVVAFAVGFSVTAELRPLPAAVTDMMASLIAASPLELRVTKESSNYGGSFIPDKGLCQAVQLEISDPVDTSSFITELRLGFFLYQRADWRYSINSDTGIQSLGRNSLQVDLHPGGEVSLGEGFVDFGTLVMSNPRDFATNVQSEIDTVCADYHLLSISLQNNLTDAAVNGQVLVKDTDSDTELLTLPTSTFFGLTASTSEVFKVYLPIGTNYSVELASLTLPEDASCDAANASGQVSTTNPDVTFTCN